MQGAKRLEVDIQYVENWIQTSRAVAAAHRTALLELPIFSKCRQVLALLLPPKLTPEVLYCACALPVTLCRLALVAVMQTPPAPLTP